MSPIDKKPQYFPLEENSRQRKLADVTEISLRVGCTNSGVNIMEMKMKRQLHAILISSSLAVSVLPAAADDVVYAGIFNANRVNTVGTTNRNTQLAVGNHFCYLSKVRLSSTDAECRVTRGSSTWTVSAQVYTPGADAYCSASCFRLDPDD